MAASNPSTNPRLNNASAKTKRPSLGERFESLSADVAEFTRTGRFIKTDGADPFDSSVRSVRAVLGIKYAGCKYPRDGYITSHRVVIANDHFTILAGDQREGMMCLTLNDDLLRYLGVDTNRMAPEDFVVPLRAVRNGEIIARQTFNEFELFVRKWVDSLLCSLNTSETAHVVAARTRRSSLSMEDEIVETNFPWKCLE